MDNFDIPAGLGVSGAVLSDQIKSLNWHARNCQFICSLPKETTSEVLEKLYVILSG